MSTASAESMSSSAAKRRAAQAPPKRGKEGDRGKDVILIVWYGAILKCN